MTSMTHEPHRTRSALRPLEVGALFGHSLHITVSPQKHLARTDVDYRASGDGVGCGVSADAGSDGVGLLTSRVADIPWALDLRQQPLCHLMTDATGCSTILCFESVLCDCFERRTPSDHQIRLALDA